MTAPCSAIPSDSDAAPSRFGPLPAFMTDPSIMMDEMAKAGVYASSGPNWDVVNICKFVSEEICTWAGQQMPSQPVGFKLEDHFKQMSYG